MDQSIKHSTFESSVMLLSHFAFKAHFLRSVVWLAEGSKFYDASMKDPVLFFLT